MHRVRWLIVGLLCGVSSSGASVGDGALLALLEEPYASVEDFRTRLDALATALEERGDDRAVFARIYVLTTDAMLAEAEAGAFVDGDWVKRLMVGFGDYYRQAMLNYESGRRDAVPQAWETAFDAAAAGDVSALQHGLLGVYIHVSHDLPFAFAAVTPAAERESRTVDFILTNDVLLALVDEVEEVAAEFDPSLSELDARFGRVDERLLAWTLNRWRVRAWERSAWFDGRRSEEEEAFLARWLDMGTGVGARTLIGSRGKGPGANRVPLYAIGRRWFFGRAG